MSSVARGPILVFVLCACIPDTSGLGGTSSDEASGGTGSTGSGSTSSAETSGTGVPTSSSASATTQGEDLTTSSTSVATSQDSTTGSTDSDSESGGRACAVDPPGSGDCPPICTNGCSDETCEIDCTGTNACDGSRTTIECPDGWPCRVRCEGQQACKDASIVCPADHACEIRCEEQQACQQTVVTCGGGTCTLTCDGHNQACDSLDFHCGSADGHVLCDVDQSGSMAVIPGQDSSCACEADRAC